MITIFTPTYNREKDLKRLYKSLLEQTNKDFIWLIVDDGSSDNTSKVIKEWSKNLNIEYYYQKNQGKHIATNTALKMCKTEYIICVDSDDTLSSDAVEIINNELLKQFDENTYAIVGPRVHTDGTLSSSWDIPNYTNCKFADIYCKYNYVGETYIVMKFDLIKDYRFPKFFNEKLVSENCMFDYLDSKECFIKTFNKLIYISDYQPDGYTMNRHKVLISCPYGTALSTLSASNNKYNSLKKRVMSYARFNAVNKVFVKDKNILKKDGFKDIKINCYIKFLSIFIYPMFYIHYLLKKFK